MYLYNTHMMTWHWNVWQLHNDEGTHDLHNGMSASRRVCQSSSAL